MGKFWAEKAPREYNQSWNERLLDIIRGLKSTTEKQASEIATVKSDTASLSTTVSSIPTTPSGTSGIPPGKIVPKPSGLTYSIVDVPDPAISGASIPKTVRWILIEWNKNYDRDFKEFEYELYAPYDTTVNIIVGKRGQSADSLTVARLMVNTIPLNTTFKVRVRTVLQSGDKSEWTLGGKWTTEAHWTTGYDTAAPAKATDGHVTQVIEGLKIDFLNPSTSDFHHSRIYRHTSNSDTTALAAGGVKTTGGGLGQRVVWTDFIQSGTTQTTYFYWVITFDNTGNPATPVVGDMFYIGTGSTGLVITSTPDNSIVSSKLTESNLKIVTNVDWSSSAVNKLTWSTGVLKFADGATYNITGETDYVLSGVAGTYHYIYFDSAVSTTAFQKTPTYSNVTGNTAVLVCVAKVGATTASKCFFVPAMGNIVIFAENISTNTLSAIVADIGTITAGILQNGAGTFSINLGTGVITSAHGITLNSGGILTLNSGADFNVNSGGDITIASGGKITVNASLGIVIASGADISINKGGDILMDGDQTTQSRIMFTNGATTIGTITPFYNIGLSLNILRILSGSDGVQALNLGDGSNAFERVAIATRGTQGTIFQANNAADTTVTTFTIPPYTSTQSFTFPWANIGGTTRFLRADGAWEVPAGGDVTKVGTPVNNQIGVWTGDGTLEGDAELTWDGTSLLLKTSTTDRVKLEAGALVGKAHLYSTAGNICGLYFYDGTTELYRLVKDNTWLKLISANVTTSLQIQDDGATPGFWIFDSSTTGDYYSFKIAGVQEFKIQNTLITMGSATTDRINFVSGSNAYATPPTETATGAVIYADTYHYGTDETRVLCKPDAWMDVQLNGSTVKIPCYSV